MKCFHAAMAALFLAAPALADVTVSFPAPGAVLMAPFALQASADPCNSQPLSAMAYSLDSGSDTVVKASTIAAQVTATAGPHVLHVKSWGNRGAVCTRALNIQVLDKLPAMPANVASAGNLQGMSTWVGEHDAATSGSSSGSTSLLAGGLSLNGQVRAFTFQYANDGGHRFHVSFPANAAATHFVYDTYLMINKYCGSTPCGKLVNVEMDMNQVLPNHDVVIYGVQCDGWSGTWDYTVNEGTPTRTLIAWRHTNVTCDPAKWTKDAWHHIQIAYSRDDSGTVTYESVSLDGVESEFSGAVGPSRFALNWAPVLLTNFQMDGQGAKGAQTMEMANTTVYSW
jgi:hypothetical protein